MGDVYRAEHQLAGRVVAFKLLRSDFAEDQDLTRRFFQEAQAVNRIRHPNIVDVLDAGFSEEGPYVVMECLEGASVSAALAKHGRFDVATAMAVIVPVLDALDAAHRHGIVHRDLKPENIFVARTPSGAQVKILDFGIAKVLDVTEGEQRPHTHTGIIFGTPDYLSPEQASGEGAVDGRSDVFAVGIVLFELLTGRRPFEAKSAVATAYKIVHEPAPRLADYGLRLDPRLQAVLDIALAKSPADRFTVTSAFADMLAPLVPEGVVRREALRELAETVEMPATQAAPEALSHARLAPTSAAMAHTSDAPVSAELPRATSDAPVSPVAPTLASVDFVVPQRPSAGSSRVPASAPRDPALERLSPTPMTPKSSSLPPAMTPRPFTRSSAPLLSTPRPGVRLSTPTTARRRASWMPRPLPAHVKGRCHARGSFMRAVGRWVERAYGVESRDEMLELLAPDDAEAFRTDAFNALVWYELDAVDALMEASTAILMEGRADEWRKLARANFEKDLAAILRPTSRLLDVQTALKRSLAGWARIFDFGALRVGAATGTRVLVRVEGFEAASLPMRYAMVGTTEALVASAGASEVAIRIASGESSFARDFEFEVSWRA